MAPGMNQTKVSRGTCFWCIKAMKWIPVLFIVTILVWSYYAYVFQLCFFTVGSAVEKVFYLLFYHVLIVMLLWSYWQTIYADTGRVPAKFKVPMSEMDKLASAETTEQQKIILETFSQNLPTTNRTVTGAVRYCDRCQHVKPDRAHHCSVCGCCILKMDHHCPWVNNCVAFFNYKFFILFLGYALLYCIYIATTALQYFVRFWKGELEGMGRFHILFLFFVAVMFAISLVSLFGYHCYLVLHNRSTLEAFRAPIFRSGPDKNGFSLGKYSNFQEVFGDNPKTWFLPVFTSLGDGVVFPVQAQHQRGVYNSMGSTQTRSGRRYSSMGDGITYPQRCMDEDTDSLLGERQRWAEEGEFEPGPFAARDSLLDSPN